MEYEEFLRSKRLIVPPSGIDGHVDIHASLFDFQRAVTRWALRRGRCAVWLDTGLGKSRIAIEWARNVAAHTSKPVLIVTPLAVAEQFVREGLVVGVNVQHLRTGSEAMAPVNVINYERFERVDVSALSGIVLDESSRLKDYTSATRNQMVDGCARIPFRLACSATPAPNDTIELGNHAEFLGIISRVEMLSRWFVHDGETTQEWRLKGHAVDDFWRWVAHWAMAARTPSDLGFEQDSSRYILPRLSIIDHVVDSGDLSRDKGMLFGYEATTLTEQRHARRVSIDDRVALCASLVERESQKQWLIWCNLNDEGSKLTAAIDGAVEVKGSDSAEEKESRIRSFLDGQCRVLVTKPSICGMGLNMQQCCRTAFVGLSHSWEQWYQAIRRVWRFGQVNEVHCHMISSSAEGRVSESLNRKQRNADAMISGMVKHMAETMKIELGATSRDFDAYIASQDMVIPEWLRKVE